MKYLPQLILYFLFLACATLPLSFQLSTILVMVFSGLVILHSIKQWNKGTYKLSIRLLMLPCVVFCIPVLGLIYTSYRPETIDRIVRYLPYLVLSLAYFLAQKQLKKEAPKYIRQGIIVGVSVTFLFLFFTLGFCESPECPNSIKDLFSYKFTYRNFIRPLDSHTTYLGLLTLMANLFLFKSNYRWEIKVLLLMINIAGLIFMASKMVLILFAIQLVFFFFLIESKKTKRIFLLFMTLFVVGLAYLFKNNLRDIYFLQRIAREIVWDFNSKNKGTSVNGKVEDDSRLARWNAIFKTAKNKTLFGHGSGSESSLLLKIHTENDLKESIKRNYNTHNQYLFYYLEMGALGLGLFLIFFFSNLYYVIETKNYEIGFLLFSLFLIAVVENYFNRTMGVLAVSLFFTFLRDKT